MIMTTGSGFRKRRKKNHRINLKNNKININIKNEKKERRSTEPVGSGGEEAGDEEAAQVVPLGRVQIALLPQRTLVSGSELKRT
jgi:hypothetical protein